MIGNTAGTNRRVAQIWSGVMLGRHRYRSAEGASTSAATRAGVGSVPFTNARTAYAAPTIAIVNVIGPTYQPAQLTACSK